MLTQRGIEANPEKCNAVIEMRSPNSVKEIQRLIGRLTAITRFLPKFAEQTQPIIQLLKQLTKFTWNDDCEQVFHKLKTTLTSPPILKKSNTPTRLHHRHGSHRKHRVGSGCQWHSTPCILRQPNPARSRNQIPDGGKISPISITHSTTPMPLFPKS